MLLLPTEKRFDWNHPPISLFIIVCLNLAVFFLYQFGDSGRYEKAVVQYTQTNLLKNEWSAYQSYLESSGESEWLKSARGQISQNHTEQIVMAIVGDERFYQYLSDHGELLTFDPYDVNDSWANWYASRKQINAQYRSLSTFQFGLIPSELNPLTLLSYQFLHGDLLHLFGNLVFLVLCGFAVEASIGSRWFMAFYLLSGIAGGLLFAVLDLDSETPLVGASGAVSGVMAMYLAVFRWQRIEFFYWVFVFAGYFRAPALLVLPVYIGKELFFFFSQPDSNVAFMAHIGGFLGGGGLIAALYWLKPEGINRDYVEEDQGVDPKREQRAIIYQQLEQFRFNAAYKSIADYVKIYGDDFDLAILRFNLSKHRDLSALQKNLEVLLKRRPVSERQAQRMAKAWRKSGQSQTSVSDQTLTKFAMNMASFRDLDLAEHIFEYLKDKSTDNSSMGALARKLSIAYADQQNMSKKKYFEELADQMIQGSL